MPGGDTAETGGRLLVIGADHRTAPPAWRDQFAIIEANLGSELDRLRAKGFGDLTLLGTLELTVARPSLHSSATALRTLPARIISTAAPTYALWIESCACASRCSSSCSLPWKDSPVSRQRPSEIQSSIDRL